MPSLLGQLSLPTGDESRLWPRFQAPDAWRRRHLLTIESNLFLRSNNDGYLGEDKHVGPSQQRLGCDVHHLDVQARRQELGRLGREILSLLSL